MSTKTTQPSEVLALFKYFDHFQLFQPQKSFEKESKNYLIVKSIMLFKKIKKNVTPSQL